MSTGASDSIHIRGARTHCLRDLELRIPRGKMTVITGVSGSGKSSLAFDTLYAEGRRRFMESLSARARAALEQTDRPDVDFIHGLTPVIAVEQRTAAGANPRDTVASVTEIADYARLLWCAAGDRRCPKDGGRIVRRTLDDCVDGLLEKHPGARAMLLAPHLRGRPAALREPLDDLVRRGFRRVRLAGKIVEAEAPDALPSGRDEVDLDIVIDRVSLAADGRARLADSLELAFREGRNRAFALVENTTGGWDEIALSLHLSCETCGDIHETLTPRHFSPNRPEGACTCCGGLGKTLRFAEELVVPDFTKKPTEGAIKPWKLGSKRMINERNALLRQLAAQTPFDADKPWGELSPETRKLILEGDAHREFVLKPGRKKAVAGPWAGVFADLDESLRETDSDHFKARLHTFQIAKTCEVCAGGRLSAASQAVKLGGVSISQFYQSSIEDAHVFVTGLATATFTGPTEEARKGLEQRLQFLTKSGLAYLSLDREYGTLSGGEIQRVRLATQLGLELAGVTYVLDEPSIGLHPADHAKLLGALTDLRDRGNTLVVVEHDRETMLAADRVVELGPGAGPEGGRLVFEGTLDECKKAPDSRTGAFLSGRAEVERTAKKLPAPDKFIRIKAAAENNLRKFDAQIPIGRLTGICGVSGSGKSTLALDILGAFCARKFNGAKVIAGRHGGIDGLDTITGFVQVTQDPIGRSARSNPATFTGIFEHLRELYSKAPLSKIRGYEAARFSFNLRGGRCEKCQGDGTVYLDMQFLGETAVPCPSCAGARYNRETLEVRHKGLNIAEVLDLTIADAHEFFKHHSRIVGKLRTLVDVGLGYIKLGQPADTLSGGEAQRLKLADELGKRKEGGCLYLLDEPTTGLHWDDVQKLLDLLFRLRDAGNTVVVIEHHTDILRHADWLLELGPGGGRHGGNLLHSGPPEGLKSVKESPTGRHL
jgi:excinuclease ABC subunit A